VAGERIQCDPRTPKDLPGSWDVLCMSGPAWNCSAGEETLRLWAQLVVNELKGSDLLWQLHHRQG
jgi:hypothetical protein